MHFGNNKKKKIGENFLALKIVIFESSQALRIFSSYFSQWQFLSFSKFAEHFIEIGILHRNQIQCKRFAQRKRKIPIRMYCLSQTHTQAHIPRIADGATYSLCEE